MQWSQPGDGGLQPDTGDHVPSHQFPPRLTEAILATVCSTRALLKRRLLGQTRLEKLGGLGERIGAVPDSPNDGLVQLTAVLSQGLAQVRDLTGDLICGYQHAAELRVLADV